MRREGGQSLVEIAVAVPLLLLILIGIFDVGRVMYFTIALSNGVREGAAYAAAMDTPNDDATLQRVCDGSGLAPLGTPCEGLDLESATRTAGAQVVTVTYRVDLFYSRILGGFGAQNPMELRASATYPVVAQ